MTQKTYGELNGHAVGIVLKDLVRRAITTIRNERFAFEVEGKLGYDGVADDMKTSADTKAQEIYLRSLREVFPQIGIIAEEDELRVPCTFTERDLYFTLDPVDGTKALVRRQSHGVGSMIALVDDDEVISAWVGDVMTQEIYGYRPDSDHVHRISEYSIGTRLEKHGTEPGKAPFVLLHDPAERYTPTTRAYLQFGGIQGYDVMGGSVGTWAARLWKGEVQIGILPPSFETPWDSTPVIGISEKLGYRFVEIRRDGSFEVIEPALPREPVQREGDLAIVHESDLKHFLYTLGKT